MVLNSASVQRPSGPGGAVQGGGAAGATVGGTEGLLPQTPAQHAADVPQGSHEDYRPAHHQRHRYEVERGYPPPKYFVLSHFSQSIEEEHGPDFVIF